MTGARAVIAAAVLLLGVSACSSDDPEPIVAPTPSSSAPESTPSDPSTSPVLSGLSPEETVRAWVDAQNLALSAGETDDLERLSLDSCETCDQFIDPIARVHADGGYFKTDGWSIDGINVRNADTDTPAVDVAVTVAGGRTVESQGAEPVVYGPEKHLLVFKLKEDGGGWGVSFVGFIS